MKPYAVSLCLCFLILPLIGNCQDSTALVSIPRWQASRLIHEGKLGRSCDSLRQQLESELLLAYKVEAFADSLLTARDRQIDLANQIAATAEKRRLNREDENKDLRKELRKARLITIAVGLVAVVALVL